MPFFHTESPPPKTSDFAHEKLQSLEYRANCVSETLKLYGNKINMLEDEVKSLKQQLREGGNSESA